MQNIDLQDYNIYTVGHGNRKIADFVSLLKRYQIELVIDVRSIPYSRFHPQFRQISLKDSLESAGVNYLWLGKALGGRPADPSFYSNGKVDYQAIKETDLFEDGIKQVLKLAEQGIKVTLMCSESDPDECHRKHLIANDLIKIGIEIFHINKVGSLEPQRNAVKNGLFD